VKPNHIRTSWAGLSLVVFLSALSAGCMAPAHIATSLERSAANRTLVRGMETLRQHIQTLQDQGDPLGDYFYAMANADGWINDVQQPEAITALFKQAAAKGVMDAKILLTLQEATSEPIPGRLDYGKSPRGNVEAWERGLVQLLPLLQQQCYARRLVVDQGRPKVAYYSIAYKIWPTFRDGHSVQNERKEWELRIAKDPQRQAVWEDLDRRCRIRRDDFLDLTIQKR